MKRVEDQPITSIELNDDRVMQYLLQNPDFFIRNAAQAEQIRVSHRVRGTVSLVEWHLARQRNHITQLEEEITLLMEQAGINEKLFARLLHLQADLATANSLQEMLDRLQNWAKKFGLAGATIRLFTDRWNISAPSNFTHLGLARSAFEPLRIQRLGDKYHYLGSLNAPELSLLLPQAKQVGSVALSLLGQPGDLGIIIFSSRDSGHYQQGMGTVMLGQLARILPDLLQRWIERV